MIWRHAKSFVDAETIRKLRNAGREMLGDTREVSIYQQSHWWAGVIGLLEKDFVCKIIGEPPHGYGMLCRRHGRLWAGVVVASQYRGRGIGTRILSLLVHDAWQGEAVFLGVRKDNLAGIRVAQRARYVLEAEISPPDVKKVEDWAVYRST